jgi:hypothetical protein
MEGGRVEQTVQEDIDADNRVISGFDLCGDG